MYGYAISVSSTAWSLGVQYQSCTSIAAKPKLPLPALNNSQAHQTTIASWFTDWINADTCDSPQSKSNWKRFTEAINKPKSLPLFTAILLNKHYYLNVDDTELCQLVPLSSCLRLRELLIRPDRGQNGGARREIPLQVRGFAHRP